MHSDTSLRSTWAASQDEARQQMLRQLTQGGEPVGIDTLGACVEDLDRIASRMGLIPIYKTAVDEKGVRGRIAAVVSAASACRYSHRMWRWASEARGA